MKIAKEIKTVVGCECLLLHAGKLAVIYASLKKTDKEDALKLARNTKGEVLSVSLKFERQRL